jgi:hypothetical protein
MQGFPAVRRKPEGPRTDQPVPALIQGRKPGKPALEENVRSLFATAVILTALAVFLVNSAIAREATPTSVLLEARKELRKPVRTTTKVNLPNVAQETRRLMRANRHTAHQQYTKSLQVVRFWENKGRWIRAPRKEKCWEVPWQRSCRIARASYKLHLTLMTVAKRKLDRELPIANDWVTAVKIVQRAFPGTESWLLSCSDAEGGHGGFVVYGGGKYYPGAEHDHTFHGDMVGGNMQYMWGTFKGHYRHGLDSLRSRGFIVSNMPSPDNVQAWLMPMGQAIAAGWARWSGNDNSHWSASFGNGC